MRCLQVLLREPFTCAHHDTSTTTTTTSSSNHHHRRHHHRSHHHHLPVDQPSRDSRGSPHRLDLTSLHLASPTDHQPIDLLVRLGVTLPNALLLPYRPIPPARVAPDHSPLYLPLSHLARRSTPTSATSRALHIPTADQISLGISLPPPRISLASPLCSLRQYLNSSPLYSR